MNTAERRTTKVIIEGIQEKVRSIRWQIPNAPEEEDPELKVVSIEVYRLRDLHKKINDLETMLSDLKAYHQLIIDHGEKEHEVWDLRNQVKKLEEQVAAEVDEA